MKPKPRSSSPIKRSATRRAIKPVSDKRAEALKTYAKLKLEWMEGRSCDRCGKRGKLDLHHSRGRIGSLLIEQRFWKSLCRPCHNFVGDNPKQARAEGFLCPAGLWNTPDRS